MFDDVSEAVAGLVAALGASVPVFQPITAFDAAVVVEAAEAGLVAIWDDAPAGAAVLLSSLACERLGLELADPAELEKSCWVRRGRDCPAPADNVLDPAEVTGGPVRCPEGGWPDEPIAMMIKAEERAGWARKLGLPALPILILGSGRAGWAPAIEAPGAACPICRGRKLSPITACLACCRSGVDGRLPLIEDHERPKRSASAGGARKPKRRASASTTTATTSASAELAGGRGRATPKKAG